MRFVSSVLTVVWLALAAPSTLATQDHAEPRTAPPLGNRFHVEPTGLSQVRPYVRGKMPVVFVHGLWARPSSWRRMIEALAADPAIDGRFQFWTFGYATGNPIPYSAYLLRRELHEVRRRLDPGKTDPALDRMVLVGHSMGGLLCKMIAVDPGHRLWGAVSNRPVGDLTGDRDDVELMRDCLIFGAHPGVRRVVYIATPHRGSRMDSGAVQAIGTRLVLLPDALRAARRRLVAANPPDFFREPFRKVLPSSIDELEWESPILTALTELAHPPALKVHTIIAVRPESPPEHRTDGVVSYESAHVARAASEKLVSAGHLCQDRLEVIGEMRRILQEHLPDTGGADRRSVPLRRAAPVPLSSARSNPAVSTASLRTTAQETVPPRDPLWRHNIDRVAIQSQPRDQPGIVVGRLVEGTPDHELPREEAAGRIADAYQRVVPAAEIRIDGRDGVDAVADEQVPRRADRPILRRAAGDDLEDPERPVIDLFLGEEGPPHRDVLAVGADDVERLVQVKVHARLGPRSPDVELQRPGQPTDRVDLDRIIPRVRPLADGPDERCPGVGISKEFRARLGPENQHVVQLPAPGSPPCRREHEAEKSDNVYADPSAHRPASLSHKAVPQIAPILVPDPLAPATGSARIRSQGSFCEFHDRMIHRLVRRRPFHKYA
jgi:pimeloyl-ACP methyl ester carboxylesterase